MSLLIIKARLFNPQAIGGGGVTYMGAIHTAVTGVHKMWSNGQATLRGGVKTHQAAVSPNKLYA